MKPLYLEIEGLNSFTERQSVDFELLGSENIFCICGPTGSGKTTILDAMIIALYGKSQRATLGELVNLNCDRAQIKFTFELEGEIYCIERTLYRSRSSKAAMWANGVMIAEQAEAVTEKVITLLGIGNEDFTKIVILEQGKFAEFLNDKKSERIKTVAKMFGLSRFKDLFTCFNRKLSETKSALNETRARLERYADYSEAFLKNAQREKLECESAALKAAEQILKTNGEINFAENEQKKKELRERLILQREDNNKALAFAEADLMRLERVPTEKPQEVIDAERQKTEAETKKAKLEIYTKDVAELEEKEKKRQSLLGDYSVLKAKLEQIEKEVCRLECELPLKRKDLENATDERIRLEKNDLAGALALRLKEGDGCPVCGGVYSGKHIIAKGGDGELEGVKAKQDVLTKSISDDEKVLAGGKETARNLVQKIEDLLRIGRELKEEIDKKKSDIMSSVGSLDLKRVLLEQESVIKGAMALIEAFEGEKQRTQKLLTDIQVKISAIKATLSQIDVQLSGEEKFKDYSGQIAELKSRLAALEAQRSEAERGGALSESFIEKCTAALPEKKELEHTAKRAEKLCDDLASLAAVFKGNKFSEYVCSKYIEDFCITAGQKLLQLSGGKYTIEYEKGTGIFFVTDYMRGGLKRQVNTLSGGEMFLASVSVAIAISMHLSGFKSFGFFFLDEGFGTLDENSIDTASDMLHTLSRETMVGVVSHRTELMERIAQKLTVTPSSDDAGTRLSVMDN